MSAMTQEHPASPESGPEKRCLEVDNLSIQYGNTVPSVSGVSVHLNEGEILGIIGESGCGKSSIGLAMLGLLPATAEIAADTFTVAGHDFIGITEEAMRAIRGNDISMIFQEPMSALNPLIRIGNQIEEVLLLHNNITRAEASARALEMLKLVQVPEPELRLKQFPHQLSGGLRQRIVIAIAMAAEPRVLIADEPTTALDVTVQAQILTLLSDLRDRTGTGIVLISHDLGVIANTCERVVVMYAGQVIEEGTPDEVLRSPGHPYTQSLLESIPTIDADSPGGKKLQAIPGSVQDSDRATPGCRFAARCRYVREGCEEPQIMRPVAQSPDHQARCLLLDPEGQTTASVGGEGDEK